ncbi:hypothetical protein V490_02419 [Pseudogymnoascus sp. VKM F-3557]|nr:hypothetical protein V490_02419 [Pseudogymnoascus sp. VKM F-3557]
MADTTMKEPGNDLNLDEVKMQSDSLERELLTLNRRKARLNEERQVEHRVTRLDRVHQDELIAATRHKEDVDTASRRTDGDEERYLLEKRHTQLARVRQDELRGSDRRKEDAGKALRQIDENKEYDLIKSDILQKQSELKSIIESMDKSMKEELRQLGKECRPSPDQGLVIDKDVLKATSPQASSSFPSKLLHHERQPEGQHPEGQQQPGYIHPSRLELLAQGSVDALSLPSSIPDSTVAKSTQAPRQALTTINEGNGNRNTHRRPSRKRKATSSDLSENKDLCLPAEKKRVCLDANTGGAQRSINRECQLPLRLAIKNNPVSLQSLPQTWSEIGVNFSAYLAPGIPAGPKFLSGTMGVKDIFNQQPPLGTPTGLKLYAGAAGAAGHRDGYDNQLLLSTPTGAKLRSGAESIHQADICRLLGYAPDSGLFNCQPLLILHRSDQVHAPVVEGARGIYYTLFHPEPPRFGQFPVLVSAEAEGKYNYVGNYVFEGSRLLQDSDVDMLGDQACHSLVTSQLMDVSMSGTPVVKREMFDILIRRGVVRTAKEANSITAIQLAKRMKHIKLTPNFSGKPVKRMDTFANKIVFSSFSEDFHARYFQRFRS